MISKGITPIITIVILVTVLVIFGVVLYRSNIFVQPQISTTTTTTTNTANTNPIVIEGIVTAKAVGSRSETWGIILDNDTSIAFGSFDSAQSLSNFKSLLGKRVRVTVSEVCDIKVKQCCWPGTMDFCAPNVLSFQEISSTSTTTQKTPIEIEGIVTVEGDNTLSEDWGIVNDSDIFVSFGEYTEYRSQLSPYLGKMIRANVSEVCAAREEGCCMIPALFCAPIVYSISPIETTTTITTS